MNNADDTQLLQVVNRLYQSGFDCIRWYMADGRVSYAIMTPEPIKIHAAALTPKEAWLVFLGWIKPING